MVYRVFYVKEVVVDADSWAEAVQMAEDEDFIYMDEYLDEERNGEQDGK